MSGLHMKPSMRCQEMEAREAKPGRGGKRQTSGKFESA